jgi:hypothetical protein
MDIAAPSEARLVHFSVRQHWLPIGSSRLPAMQAQHLMRASERSVPDCHDTTPIPRRTT